VDAVGGGDPVQLGADGHEVGVEDAGVDVVAVGGVRGVHAVGVPSSVGSAVAGWAGVVGAAEGAGSLRSRLMYIASVPCTCGHSCTAGPAPRSRSCCAAGSTPARTASRASSCSASV